MPCGGTKAVCSWGLTRDGLEELRREISDRSVPTGKVWWGYVLIRIADPDGNELHFLSE
jgi:hypothetical protein